MRQCRDVWLKEARVWHSKATPMLQKFIQITKSKIEIGGDSDWGVITVTATKEENAQGYHQDNLTVIAEEASGVPREIITQFKGTLSNPDSLFLMIGNPNCVLGSTEIYDPSRGRVRADLFRKGQVVSMDEKTLMLGTHDATGFRSGVKKCVKVSLAAGQQIELSHDHPIYTEHGWVHAGLLQEDDLVATPSKLSPPTQYVDYSDDCIKFIAYMLTDGCCSWAKGNSPHCGFTQMPGDVMDEFCSLSMTKDHTIRKDGRGGLADRVEVRGKESKEILHAFGLAGGYSTTKRIPHDFFLLSDKKLALLINRMWACDGTFTQYGPSICLANRKLLEDIRMALLRFGIHCRVWYTPVHNTKTFDYLNGRTFDAWKLTISERHSVELWNQHIGPVLGKPNKFPLPLGTNPNSDVVPITNVELGIMFDELGIPSGKGKGGRRSELRQKYSRVRRMSKSTFLEFCLETGYKGKFLPLAVSDLRWEKVLRVEAIGEHEVFDLTVPERGNFVADGIVIHNTLDCAFFDCFNRQRHKWKCITFNAEDTARDYPHIVNPQRNKDLAEEFDRDSDVYRVRVLGEFPRADPNTILNHDEVEACTGPEEMMYKFVRAERPVECGGGRAKQISVDFSRFGGDESVIMRRAGNAIVQWGHWSHVEPLHVLYKAFEMQTSAGWKNDDTIYVPDANGMGEGMMIHLYDAKKNVIEFKNQCSAVDDQYENIITEAWFGFRKLVRAKNCYIPNDNQLIQQLCGRRYKMTNKGKIVIETKDDYKDRNEGLSPDRADALVMAFYDQVYAVGNFASKQAGGHTVGAKVALI